MNNDLKKLDAKMDRHFSTIMAFTALWRLLGGFMEKADMPHEAEQTPDDATSPKKKS